MHARLLALCPGLTLFLRSDEILYEMFKVRLVVLSKRIAINSANRDIASRRSVHHRPFPDW